MHCMSLLEKGGERERGKGRRQRKEVYWMEGVEDMEDTMEGSSREKEEDGLPHEFQETTKTMTNIQTSSL